MSVIEANYGKVTFLKIYLGQNKPCPMLLYINDIAIMFWLIYSEDSDFEWWRPNQVNIDELPR